MGNENSEITFPIENNNHYNKIKINSKKSKNRDIFNKPIDLKNKNPKNPKILKGYIIPRISATPDRNIKISGMNKDNIDNSKRYGSYEKSLKTNSNYIKNKDNDFRKIIRITNKNTNKTILSITNLLNSLYTYGIDKEISEINLLNSGTKNLNFNSGVKNKNDTKKEGINIMFDATFKYNYYYNNSNRVNRKKSNNKYRYNSPRIHDSISQSNEYNDIKTSKNNNMNYVNSIKITEPKNTNDNYSQNVNIHNTTLVLNKYSMENEVISVNNKKKNFKYNQKNINNKKYSESKFVSESESGFVSSEEMSLIKNIEKIDRKTKEEEVSESQTDNQEMINHNLTNKNKINNIYFMDSKHHSKLNNNFIFKNNELNIISKINNVEINSNEFNHNDTHKHKDNELLNSNNNNNNIGCSLDSIKTNQIINDDEIILMNNETNKDDENNTYMEIIAAMTEKKNINKNKKINLNINNNINNHNNMNIINKTSNNNNNNNHKYKKIHKDQKNTPIRKQITPPNIQLKREITPQNIYNKREITPQNTGNKKEITPKNTTNKIILRSKKVIPLKKFSINTNVNINNSKNNCYNYKKTNNINGNCSPKKYDKKLINILNKNNISPKKNEKKSINKSNNNSPIQISNGNSYLNNLKNKKNSESPSPSNSPTPMPSNHFNNNYKDRYAYKKMTQINNSLKKNRKANDNINNSSNKNSINTTINNNINNNNINNNNKNSNMYYKINNINNTININNTNYLYSYNSKKPIRNSGNKKIIFFKKERISGNSLNNKTQNNNNNNYNNEITEGEQRTKSNDQKYTIYNSKNVLSSTKKKQK